METVSGEVVSTVPISLSKAAKTLSNFATSDNGASPAFAAYLNRSSASFDELAQLHKRYRRTSGGKHGVKKQRSESIIVSEGSVCSVKNRSEVDQRKEKRGKCERAKH